MSAINYFRGTNYNISEYVTLSAKDNSGAKISEYVKKLEVVNGVTKTADHRLSVWYKGVEFRVVTQDIRSLDVDVIVTLANGKLLPDTEVCMSCLESTDRNMKPEGGTPGEKLKTKHLIRVGPIQSQQIDLSKTYEDLYSKILDVAKKVGAQTIAFPVIGSGLCEEMASLRIVARLKKNLDDSAHGNPQVICFAVSPKEFPFYDAAFERTFLRYREEEIGVKGSVVIPSINDDLDNDPLYLFLIGKGSDSSGRFIDEILNFDNFKKEMTHDYIQELFPTLDESAFNQNARILKKALLPAMKRNPVVIDNRRKAFKSMLQFYGFEYIVEKKAVVQAEDFVERSREWMTRGNHNFLRLTRILKCLTLFGLKDEAQALFAALSKLHKERPQVIGNSFGYWKQAVL